MAVTLLEKYVDESRLYDFDFTLQAEIVAGETLTGTPVVSSIPSGLTFGTPIIGAGAKKVQVRISSGEEGAIYDVKCIVSTSTGSTLVGCGELKILGCR